MSAHEQKHPYHLVDPSPWPAIGAVAALVLTGGLVLYMHEYAGGPWVLLAGVFLVIVTMAGWWRDVIKEAEHQGHHTPVVQLTHRYGMALFIASEVMFFVAFFWAFFAAAFYPAEGGLVGGVWPPKGVAVLDPWDLPFLNTIILLTSGATLTWAHHELLEGNRKNLIWGLGITIILGAIFTGIQAYEYVHAPFTFAMPPGGGEPGQGGIYSSTFYMATGFHGFHVLVGTTFLIVCFFRALKGHFTPNHHFGFEAAAWYWHFVDVVWIFLFCGIYWWGSGNAPIAH